MPKLKNVGFGGCCELHDVRTCDLLAGDEGGFGLGVETDELAGSEVSPRGHELLIASWQENAAELNPDKGLKF
jgi:hypothetical protein